MRNKGEENVYKDEGEGVAAVKRRKERKGVEEGRKGETRSTERGCDDALSHAAAATATAATPFLLYICRTCATATPGDVEERSCALPPLRGCART